MNRTSAARSSSARFAAALALATAALAAVAPASSAAPRSCRPAGAKAVASSTEGTVYKAGKSRDTTRYVACRTRRSTPLALGGADCFNAEAPSDFVISGRWLAYVSTSCDSVSGSDTVMLVDLRKRKRRYAGAASSTPAAKGDPYAAIATLAVARSGEVAWIATYVAPGQARTYEVRRSTATRSESVLLDAGPDVAPDSLALSANLVYWTRGGRPRSAPLR